MWQRQRLASVAGLVFALMLAAGCAPSAIAYKPMAAAAPTPAVTVALLITDERPADHGGSDKRVVGQVRGSYGIPSAVADSNPNVVVDTVSQLTADALAQSGVGVAADGKTLAGRVTHYWLDGFTGYKGTVTAQYTLSDGAGKSLWSKELTGASGDVQVFKSAQSLTQDIFGRALRDLATKAATEFKSAEFQEALKQ